MLVKMLVTGVSDNLFTHFFRLVSMFIEIGHAVPSKQSQYGVEHNQPSSEQLKRWSSLMQDVIQSDQKLYGSVQLGIENNVDAIDVELETFRELPRKMDYYGCYWSAYYPEIQKIKSQMAILLGQIDKKYTLGKYLMRERIAKYQS